MPAGRPPIQYDRVAAFRLFQKGTPIIQLSKRFGASSSTIYRDMLRMRHEQEALKAELSHRANGHAPASTVGKEVSAAIKFLQGEIAKTEAHLKMQKDCLASLQTVFATELKNGTSQ